jgi:hypothetical protein
MKITCMCTFKHSSPHTLNPVVNTGFAKYTTKTNICTVSSIEKNYLFNTVFL